MRPLSRMVPLLGAAGLLGCHEVTDPATSLQVGGDFTIGVTEGTTPSFSWPGAGASRVLVSVRNGNAGYVGYDLWEVASTGAISSPVRYGSRLTGSGVVNSPSALVKGSRYRVTVSRSDSRSAYRDFIP